MTPDEIFDYVSQATDKVYDDPAIPNGYSTQEEHDLLYSAIAAALLDSESEVHFLDNMTAEEFEEAFDLMEDQNFHSECAALARVADGNGLVHPYIDQVKTYAGCDWDV